MTVITENLNRRNNSNDNYEVYSILNFMNKFNDLTTIYKDVSSLTSEFTMEEIHEAFQMVDNLILTYDENIQPLFDKLNFIYSIINKDILDALSSYYHTRIEYSQNKSLEITGF